MVKKTVVLQPSEPLEIYTDTELAEMTGIEIVDKETRSVAEAEYVNQLNVPFSGNKATKRTRKPQSEANVTIFVSEYTPDMYHVYAKQGHSIVAVYGYIPSIDSFLNLAPTNEIAKAWGSMYDMVKANAQQVGNFHPTIANNIQFVNSLVATIIKANTATANVVKTEASV